MNYALLPIVWLSWGLSYPATAVALAGFDAWSCRCLVMLTGGGVLLVGAALAGRSLRVPRPLWRDLVIAALCNMAIFQLCMTYGVLLMGAGRTAVLVYTMPLWAAVFARLVLGEAMTRARIAALALGLGGVATLLSQDLSGLQNAPLGAALTLLAAVSFGFGTVWTKRQRWTLDLGVVVGWQVLLGALPLIPLWAVFGAPFHPAAAPPASWLALLYLAVIGNAIAYIAWFRVIRAFSATVSGLGALAVPCVGLVSSAVLLRQSMTPADLGALALICVALALVLLEARLGLGVSAPPARRGAAGGTP
jgi:drug/metabolite transporter (DMT)-like permease